MLTPRLLVYLPESQLLQCILLVPRHCRIRYPDGEAEDGGGVRLHDAWLIRYALILQERSHWILVVLPHSSSIEPTIGGVNPRATQRQLTDRTAWLNAGDGSSRLYLQLLSPLLVDPYSMLTHLCQPLR